MAAACTHLSQVRDVTARTPDGCEECLAIGGQWVHLRLCLVCGHVACCDSSPYRHASKHHEDTGHAVMRSHEPNETWRWCYIDRRLAP